MTSARTVVASSCPSPRRATAAELEQQHRDTTTQITATQARADQQIVAARADAARCARERDDAIAAARDTRHAADTETSRARQAETDARAETDRVRADATRERDTLTASCQAQLAAAQALTDAQRARAPKPSLEAERADRSTLTSHLTATTSNGQASQP